MSYSLKTITTAFLIISAVHLISCASIGYLEDAIMQKGECVIIPSTEGKTLKRCRYIGLKLAECDNDKFVSAKNCTLDPNVDFWCRTCLAVNKFRSVPRVKDVPAAPVFPAPPPSFNYQNYLDAKKKDEELKKINDAALKIHTDMMSSWNNTYNPTIIHRRPRPSLTFEQYVLFIIVTILIITIYSACGGCKDEPRVIPVRPSHHMLATPMPWYDNYDKFLKEFTVSPNLIK